MASNIICSKFVDDRSFFFFFFFQKMHIGKIRLCQIINCGSDESDVEVFKKH